MAALIAKKYGVKAVLESSGPGKFEVFKDGRLIYSKLKTGRFPQSSEIIKKLAP